MRRSFLLSLSLLLIQSGEPARKITEAEIKAFINSGSGMDTGSDVCDSLDQIYISHIEYYDFIGDGQQEAIVVASTCMTGTAGPDVHAVYKRGAGGKLVELPFLDVKGDQPAPELSASIGADKTAAASNASGSNASAKGEGGVEIPLFGNRNYTLAVENGKLVARFGDTSDREEPAVIWYKWDGAKFVLAHKKIQGPFLTSYDCAKATKELDRAICYSPSAAALDVKLAQSYKAALQRLPPEKRQELQAQQREWLAQREKACVVYKWWVECLQDSYTKRIAELKWQ